MATLRLRHLVFSVCVFALTGCGLSLPKEEVAPPAPSRDLGQGSITGIFTALDGSRVDLSGDSSSIQVLMFVSETCAVCREETEALVHDRGSRGIPTNARFYSVLVGSIAEDAEDWKSSLGVNWTVGLDPGDSLFRAYCPDLQTPCTILRNPENGKLSAFTGLHSIADWEQFTGPWAF